MEFEHRKQGTVLVLSLDSNSLDAHNATVFRDRVSELLELGNDRIVLDLSRVEFLDSTGLGALVTILKRMRGRGRLALAGVDAAVLNVFRLTRMDRVFEMAPDVDAAAASLADQTPAGTAAR